MVYTDPYTPTHSRYECCACGNRETAKTLGACPECGGGVKNIAVPRE